MEDNNESNLLGILWQGALKFIHQRDINNVQHRLDILKEMAQQIPDSQVLLLSIPYASSEAEEETFDLESGILQTCDGRVLAPEYSSKIIYPNLRRYLESRGSHWLGNSLETIYVNVR